MKLFAQHGFGDGQKIRQGFADGLIDGVIYSPKDISLERLTGTLDDLATRTPASERLFDPQFYATLVANAPNSRCGSLMIDYSAYFSARRRGQLESESRVVEDLRAVLAFSRRLNLTAVIAPGILIPRSLNSIEAVVAKTFIRNSKPAALTVDEGRPVLATLAIGCEALRRHDELLEFLTDLTLMENRPEGFYLVVGASSADGRNDIFNTDTIAGWLFLNHVLSINGFTVVNGYSDLMTPFLGACGASAGATGWWSNLRSFSLSRFAPEGSGGRLPIPRYLSCALINRITFDELERLREPIPAVLNNLPTDALYPVESGSEPDRPQEVLQSWDAIRELNRRLVVEGDIRESLAACRLSIDRAYALYLEVGGALFSPMDSKSNESHLEPLREGIRLFEHLAELSPPDN